WRHNDWWAETAALGEAAADRLNAWNGADAAESVVAATPTTIISAATAAASVVVVFNDDNLAVPHRLGVALLPETVSVVVAAAPMVVAAPFMPVIASFARHLGSSFAA